MRLVCRDRQGSTSRYTIESLIRRFFHESFNSSFVYIISPWISLFEFSKPLMHYPFVDTNRVDEALRALADVTDVKVLTRCVDDSIDIGFMKFLRIWREVQTGVGASEALINYLIGHLDNFTKTLELVITLRDILGDNIRFDLKQPGYGRLHTKLYVNDFSVILGSVNFTKSGIADNGNWECLLKLRRDHAKAIHTDALKVAERHFSLGQDFSTCERVTLSLLAELNLIDKPVASLDELLEYFNNLKHELSSRVY